MTRFPPFLQIGDTVGLVCPAGYMDKRRAAACIRVLKDWGYKVKIGRTLGSNSSNYFSGTDEERIEDLQQFLDDDETNAILCARGGYGVTRIIDRINFKKFRKHPKWIIGFSDITILLSHIYSNFGISSIHGPMASAFNDDGYRTKYVQSLKRCLEGQKQIYVTRPNRLNRNGKVQAELIGGNLSLLVHISGTTSDTGTRGKILFLEDIGEYQYNIDRMMYHLKRSGKLKDLAGLILGKFSDTRDTERPFGKKLNQMILEVVQEYDYPVCFDFPVSHTKENYALKIGAEYVLTVGKNNVSLKD